MIRRHLDTRRLLSTPGTGSSGPQVGAHMRSRSDRPVLTEDLQDLVVDSEGEQRFWQLSEEGLQDHSRNVNVELLEVHGLP